MKAALFALEGALAAPWRPWWRTPRLRRHAAPLVAAHWACGHLTVLLTAADEATASRYWKALRTDVVLPIPADQADAAGRLRLVERFSERYAIDPTRSFGYAARRRDLPWLAWLGQAAMVNGGPWVRARARAEGWRVLDLDVPLPAEALSTFLAD